MDWSLIASIFWKVSLGLFLINTISLWHGFKAGWGSFVSRQPKPSKSPLSEDSPASEVSAK